MQDESSENDVVIKITKLTLPLWQFNVCYTYTIECGYMDCCGTGYIQEHCSADDVLTKVLRLSQDSISNQPNKDVVIATFTNAIQKKDFNILEHNHQELLDTFGITESQLRNNLFLGTLENKCICTIVDRLGESGVNNISSLEIPSSLRKKIDGCYTLKIVRDNVRINECNQNWYCRPLYQ